MFFLNLLILSASAILPALVWQVFFLREDIHPEPRKIISSVFFSGALATIPALFFQIIFQKIASNLTPLIFFLGLALIEELFKFLAAYRILNKNRFFDEPVDAMIYMVAAASGFATVENVLIAIGSFQTLSADFFLSGVNIFILRFIGATLLHILASAAVGYYWGKTLIFEKRTNRYLFQGIILAALLHGLFNIFIALSQDSNLIFSSLILIAAAFFILNDFEVLKKTEAQKI